MARKHKLRYNRWTMGGLGADLFEKSDEALELERLNPLRGVDEWRLGQIFDDARDGIYADLAWLYNEIEAVEPALLTCCDMRESAAGECGWIVRTADARRVRGYDQTLAEDQRDALLAAFGAVDDDLAELAGHLVSAFFRGAAHALPLWNADGSLAGFRHLDLWNFALDRKTGVWYWNADASRDGDTFQPVPPGELVSLAVSRHVDHAALPIFIRSALGAKRYGVWLDRFGIPPVGVIMPATAEKGDQPAYMDLARKFARGGSGILPNGSNVIYGTEARAVCPFPEFIRFQQQQIYAVGLGRVQSGETGGDNLGGNAAGVVETGFRRIVRRDARRIAAAINAGVTRRIVARLFPGRPVLAQFAWDTDEKRTSREVLEDAGLARNAGLAIDRVQLEELTGYTLSDAPQAQPGGFGGFGDSATPLQFHAKALQNARKGTDATSVPPDGETRLEAILDDFAEKLGEEMLGEMASAAAGAVKGEGEGEDEGEGAVKNSTDANGAEHERMNSGEEEEELVLINDNDNRDKDGQFAEKGTGNQTGGPHETNLEKRQRTCQEALDKFNASTDHPSDDDVASGKVSIEEALEKGFSTTFAGHKLVFFTKQKITDKYVGFKDDPGRIKLVKEAVEKKNRMQPRPHNGEQTAFVESAKTSAPASKLLVVVADTKTGVVVSIMKAPVEYVRKHFK